MNFARHAGLLAAVALAVPAWPAAAQPGHPVILVVGASLSAEYGLARGTGWVALLADRLAKEAPQATVVNASISGDTTAGGRARLPALLAQHRPDIVLIEIPTSTLSGRF